MGGYQDALHLHIEVPRSPTDRDDCDSQMPAEPMDEADQRKPGWLSLATVQEVETDPELPHPGSIPAGGAILTPSVTHRSGGPEGGTKSREACPQGGKSGLAPGPPTSMGM